MRRSRVRSIFKFGYGVACWTSLPRFGPSFEEKSRSAKVLRQNRARRGLRMFEREELLALLDACLPTQKAMVLLGINGGLGNHDVATLPTKALDLKKGWLVYPRPKTGIERRIPLWPETVAASSRCWRNNTRRKTPRTRTWCSFRCRASLTSVTPAATASPRRSFGSSEKRRSSGRDCRSTPSAILSDQVQGRPRPGGRAKHHGACPARRYVGHLPGANRRRPPSGRHRPRPRLAVSGRCEGDPKEIECVHAGGLHGKSGRSPRRPRGSLVK